jgi:alpha-beta hydrolase superfamily lysophospholipase
MTNSTIRTQQGVFQGFAGLNLFYQSWHPLVGKPASIAVSIHGGGDYAGGIGYQWLAHHLAREGHAVYGYDLRGHGRSPGTRLHIDEWRELRADLSAFLQVVRAHEPDVPIFLFGISLGSIIVLDYAIHYPYQLRGVIAASAPVGELGISPTTVSIARILSKLAPRFELRAGLDVSSESRDIEVATRQVNDPLKYNGGTVRFFTEMLMIVKQIQVRSRGLTVPLLMLQGSADPVAIPDEVFFRKVGSADKQRKVYEGARHNLLIETNREEIFKDIAQWIAAHI